MLIFVLFKQKTAYEWRISDWSSDVCASDLNDPEAEALVTWRWHGLKPDLASKPVPSGEQDKQPDRQPPQGPVARGRGSPDRGGSCSGQHGDQAQSVCADESRPLQRLRGHSPHLADAITGAPCQAVAPHNRKHDAKGTRG